MFMVFKPSLSPFNLKFRLHFSINKSKGVVEKTEKERATEEEYPMEEESSREIERTQPQG